jgi:hypothetical protein
MLTFTCTVKGCANENIDYNFLGNFDFAECGGCKEKLVGTDLRPDPELPENNYGLTEQK